MAFCSKCGNQIADGSRFCSFCGTPTANSNNGNESQRRQIFEGVIHKCPNCGEVLESFTAFCPACGLELRNTKTSDTVKEFALKLIDANNVEQKIDLINSFPVPNNKEDIYEFMVLASTNIGTIEKLDYGSQNQLMGAWLVKVEQCFQKAKLVLTKDEDITYIENVYAQTYQKLNEAKKKAKRNQIIGVILRTVGTWGGLIILIIGALLDYNEDMNTSMFHIGGLIVMVAGAIVICATSQNIFEPIVGIGTGVVAMILGIIHSAEYNGSAIEIAGGLTIIIASIGIISTIKRGRKIKNNGNI